MRSALHSQLIARPERVSSGQTAAPETNCSALLVSALASKHASSRKLGLSGRRALILSRFPHKPACRKRVRRLTGLQVSWTAQRVQSGPDGDLGPGNRGIQPSLSVRIPPQEQVLGRRYVDTRRKPP